MLKKNWSNMYLVDDYYLVKNIKFMKDGKPYNLDELAISYEDLRQLTNFADTFSNKHDALAAYYRTQLFLNADVEFQMVKITDSALQSHILDVNDLIDYTQPYDTIFDTDKLARHSTGDKLAFHYSTTWFTIISADFELACTFMDERDAAVLREQAVFETLCNTLPVEFVGSATVSPARHITAPPRSHAEYKRYIVNNGLLFPSTSDLSVKQYNYYREGLNIDEWLDEAAASNERGL